MPRDVLYPYAVLRPRGRKCGVCVYIHIGVGSALLVSTRWAMPEPLRVRRVTVQVLTLFLSHFLTNAESGELIGETEIMKKIEVNYDFFKVEDGNALNLEERIKELSILLSEEDVFVEFDDDQTCSNEEELRAILVDKGILKSL